MIIALFITGVLINLAVLVFCHFRINILHFRWDSLTERICKLEAKESEVLLNASDIRDRLYKLEYPHAIIAKASGLEPESVVCRMSIAAPNADSGEFMFMPAGTQTINATKGVPGQRGKDITVNVLVDKGTESKLQAQLDAINSRNGDRAYFDFNHDDKEASFWPSRFTWRDQPVAGVYVAGDWSDSGKRAINGKVYRSFSPVFHVDDDSKNPARIICNLNARPNMGGLVNNPAFKNNLPLWAKQAGANQQTHQRTVTVTEQQLAELRAKIQLLEQEEATLQAASNQADAIAEDHNNLAAKQSEVAKAKQDLDNGEIRAKMLLMEKELLGNRTVQADAAVQAAVRKGQIPSRDEALKAKWRQLIVEDPEKASLLASMPAGIVGQTQPQFRPPQLSISGVQVTREDSRAVLGKMGEICTRQLSPNVAYRERPTHAKELAALYAKEIMPRYNAGEDIPLTAGNTLGTLAQTLTAIRTLELLTLTFPLLSQIFTDFSDAIVSYGDTLNTRVVGIPTVQTFNNTTGWPTNSDVTTTDVAITYNQFKGVPVVFMAHEIGGTVRRLFDEIAPGQAYALGKDIVDYIYALITAAYTNTVTAAGLGTFGRSTLVDIGVILDEAANPEMGRFAILNNRYYSALSKDNTIIQLAAFQKAEVITQRLSTSTMQDVEGFRTIKAVNLPATSIAGKTLKGFAGTKSSLVLGTRLSADYVNAIPGAANGNLQVVTTPGGFSANLVQFVSHTGGYAAQRMEVMYGAARGQVAAGALLTDV